jgi:hypothetical protein
VANANRVSEWLRRVHERHTLTAYVKVKVVVKEVKQLLLPRLS